LLRAEEARRQAAEAAAAADTAARRSTAPLPPAPGVFPDAATVPTPVVSPGSDDPAGRGAGTDETTVLRPVRDEADQPEGARDRRAAQARESGADPEVPAE